MPSETLVLVLVRKQHARKTRKETSESRAELLRSLLLSFISYKTKSHLPSSITGRKAGSSLIGYQYLFVLRWGH